MFRYDRTGSLNHLKNENTVSLQRSDAGPGGWGCFYTERKIKWLTWVGKKKKKSGEEILFWGFIQMRLLVNEKLNTLSSVWPELQPKLCSHSLVQVTSWTASTSHHCSARCPVVTTGIKKTCVCQALKARSCQNALGAGAAGLGRRVLVISLMFLCIRLLISSGRH